MRNLNLIDRSKMKKIFAGKKEVANGSGGGLCDNWSNAGYDICFNCCLTYSSIQPNPPSDPNGISNCDSICSRNG